MIREEFSKADMNIDDSIVRKYLSGESPETYKDTWIYRAFGARCLFEEPDPENRRWVSELCEKLKHQIRTYQPRNEQVVKSVFTDFDVVARDYTILLVVGFADPYDAMAIQHDGVEYLIFDLIQFRQESLAEDYSCHRVLTHELIHLCLHRRYPKPDGLSYIDELSYTAFDEGFAHALPYPDEIDFFEFDAFLTEQYKRSRMQLERALSETDAVRQREFLIAADTGDYWDKFASISGKLYVLSRPNHLNEIYLDGWHGFAHKVANDATSIAQARPRTP